MSTKVILLVGIELSNFVYLAMLLEQSGYKVLRVLEWFEGVISVEGQLPDLIIIDDQAPKFSAIQLSKQLSQHPLFADVPRILLLSSRDSETHEAAIQAKASGIISKPILPQKLVQLISDLTEKVNCSRGLRA